MLLARFPDEAPATWLFAWAGHAWGTLFGWDFVTLRYFAVVWMLIIAIVGGLYFYSRSRLPRISIALTGVAMMMMAERQPLFSWHYFTPLMLFLTIVCTLRSFERPKIWRFILLGIITGLTILARIPNVVILPLLAVAICLRGVSMAQRRLMWQMLGIVTGVCVATILACVTLSYGSPAAYWQALTAGLPSNHGMRFLVTMIVQSFAQWSPYWTVIGFGAACVMLGHRIIRGRHVSLIISLATALYIGLTLYGQVFDGYARLIQHYVNGLMFCAIFYTLLKTRKPGYLPERLQCVTLLLLMVVPVAGSNIGVVRCIGAQLYPVMAAIALPWLSRRVCLYGSLVIAAFIGHIGLHALAASHEDAGALYATATVEHPRLTGVRTAPERAAEVRDIISLTPPEDSGEQFATAFTKTYLGYLTYYLADTWPTICAHEWRRVSMHTDSAQVAECMQFVNNGRRPLRVIFQPDNGLAPGNDILENALIAAKPDSIIATDHYRAYLYR